MRFAPLAFKQQAPRTCHSSNNNNRSNTYTSLIWWPMFQTPVMTTIAMKLLSLSNKQKKCKKKENLAPFPFHARVCTRSIFFLFARACKYNIYYMVSSWSFLLKKSSLPRNLNLNTTQRIPLSNSIQCGNGFLDRCDPTPKIGVKQLLFLLGRQCHGYDLAIRYIHLTLAKPCLDQYFAKLQHCETILGSNGVQQFLDTLDCSG